LRRKKKAKSSRRTYLPVLKKAPLGANADPLSRRKEEWSHHKKKKEGCCCEARGARFRLVPCQHAGCYFSRKRNEGITGGRKHGRIWRQMTGEENCVGLGESNIQRERGRKRRKKKKGGSDQREVLTTTAEKNVKGRRAFRGGS